MKKNYQLYIQMTLWLVYAILLTLLINKTFSTTDAIVKSGTIVIIQISLFYYNSQKLFPLLMEDKKTWKYILSIIAILFFLLLFFSWFERQFFPEMLSELGRSDLSRMRERGMNRPHPRPQFVNVHIAFDFLALLLVLILSTAYSATNISRKKELIDSTKNLADLSSEMKFLKSQINPHFLFNALNNIYSLTLIGSEKSSEMILKLSAMLRYILYECNGAFVSIEKEWEYIENFVAFQQLKSEKPMNVHVTFNNDVPGELITPMIFIPFIENAFKHGNIENKEEGKIEIKLNNKENEIIFQVDNSVSSETKNRDEMGGIGLENVKRRLELVYGEKFDLIINDTINAYAIMLRIEKKN